MTDQITSAVESAAPPAIPESFDSSEDAARFWVSARDKQPQADAAPTGEEGNPADPDLTAARADPATAEQELSQQDNAAQPEADPGESEAADPEADKLPSIEPPRSWSKDDKEAFKAYPREAQEKIAAQVARQEAEFLRRSNEAAEKSKAVTAKEQAAEQARQQYENAARATHDILIRQQQSQFPDIKTMADVVQLSQTDPFRFIQWQAHQQELQAVDAAVREADARTQHETQAKRSAYAQAQDAKLKELVPDYADAKKLSAARDAAMPLLAEYGLSNEQLQKWAQSDAGFELLQHAGFQKIVSDLMGYREAEAKLKAAADAARNKPVPPVQRPGTHRPASAAHSEQVQALTHRLTESGSMEDGVALLIARRNGRRPN